MIADTPNVRFRDFSSFFHNVVNPFATVPYSDTNFPRLSQNPRVAETSAENAGTRMPSAWVRALGRREVFTSHLVAYNSVYPESGRRYD